MQPRSRSRFGRLLDRILTPVFSALGHLVGRPAEPTLQALAGRSRGALGPEPAGSAVQRLEAGREALSEGRLGQALSLFAEAAEMNPEDPWPWHGRGDALLSESDAAGALVAYDEAANRGPTSALVQLGRGNALERLGRIDEAVAAWQTALRRDPGLEWALAGLSRHGALPATEKEH